MTLLHLTLLALVQGITEFLPISSSAHLILLPRLLDIVDQGLALDVAVHVGTLGAVMLFFREDVGRALRGIRDLIAGRRHSEDARLAYLLAVATVPVVVAGFILTVTGLVHLLRSMAVIGWASIVFGIVLYWADQTGATERRAESFSLRDALVMGVWQAFALIPGTSRSGATITASRLLAYRREDGARIAMLMSIPTIVASGVLLGADVIGEADWAVARDGAIGAALAFVAAYLALAVMMRLLRTISFTPYVIYRIGLGAVLLWIAYA
jgi:undecaprenyl-diphosphatase